ncbi:MULTISPECIES: DMT family transporter [unclassified Brenneria]|uniref:DMT family transporter n=1 Tax=unclassified Brenneria TaxID=2634434 RepID=UPI0015536CFD|nr:MULTISPECIES: multidrug efflux SMR transporter [unclassified Brenneria]MBJ7221524.1 multidrug efflux SMR transporter [Brenneria sp. L3-3C-1]MEE3642766.1 multidrug efflux SMR transporter [Brenneria sp. L3_3C_1]MEE3651052.1 multidrug efflux SMR transporter [Brenneria sp. HEZEL_4_2_4]NPD01007.1 multidrug efflux SMR transporter [Brenneria sp. hezel4-2-4]
MSRGKCYFWLFIAVITEIFATTMLILSDGISRAIPSVFATLGYAVSYYTLTLALNRIPMGFAYAIWSGIGILATNILGTILFNETLQSGALIGMWLIIIGVLIINLLSNTETQAERI